MFARMFPLPAGELFFEGSLCEKRLRERAITLGVNWSPNRWVRVQGNLIRDTISIPTGEVPLSGALVDGPTSSFWSRVVRFRFAL